MARSLSKADQILNDARRRVERAETDVANKSAALRAAEAALEAHRDAYASLENALTPTPRKKSTAKPATAPKDKPETKAQASNSANCGICGNPADHSDHDPTYLSSHVFEAPGKSKRSRKSAATSSEVESVSAVGASAGD